MYSFKFDFFHSTIYIFVRVILFFFLLCNIPLYEYIVIYLTISLMKNWIVFSLGLLHIRVQRIFLYLSLSGRMHPFLLWGYMVGICLALVYTAK